MERSEEKIRIHSDSNVYFTFNKNSLALFLLPSPQQIKVKFFIFCRLVNFLLCYKHTMHHSKLYWFKNIKFLLSLFWCAQKSMSLYSFYSDYIYLFYRKETIVGEILCLTVQKWKPKEKIYQWFVGLFS